MPSQVVVPVVTPYQSGTVQEDLCFSLRKNNISFIPNIPKIDGEDSDDIALGLNPRNPGAINKPSKALHKAPNKAPSTHLPRNHASNASIPTPNEAVCYYPLHHTTEPTPEKAIKPYCGLTVQLDISIYRLLIRPRHHLSTQGRSREYEKRV